MNKKFLALCAVATAFVFTGCQKEKDVQVDNTALTHTIAFTAEKGDETRTAIASEADGLVTYKWIAGDEERMHVYEKVGEGNAVEGTVTSMDMSSDGSTATFYVTFEGDAPTGDITYTATYGGTVSNSQNPLIPSDQYPGVDTFDPAADALVAEPIVKEARDKNPSFRFKMHRQASVNKMTLKGLPVGEKIEFVSFESDKYHYGYATPAGNVTNGGKKLTMHYTANNTVPASGEFPVYFTTAGVENATFTVTVKTDQHRYVKNSSKTITFSVGRVRRFGVDMTDTEEPEGRTFTLVENVNDLVIGSNIVIAANGDKNFAMSTDQKTNNRGEADAVKSADKKTLTLTETVQVFTLEAGTVEGTYAFHCVNGTAEGYIYAASSSSNYLRTKKELDDNGSWTIVISNNEALITAQGENSHNILRRNAGDKLYSCYGSATQQAVYLYQAGSLPDPGMSWSDEAAVATLTSAGVEFTPPTLNLGNATNVTYASSKPTVATIDNNGDITIVGAGETVISAIFAGNTSYAPSTVTYTLTVTDSREKVATPTFSPAAGAVDAGTVVTISTTTAGATIYYTTDGTAPTTASTQGTTVTIDEAKTIKAIAVKANYIDSDVATAAYSLTTPGATIATILADNTITAQHTVHYDLTGVTVMAAQSGTSTKKNYIIADETGVMLLYCNVSPALVVGSQYDVQGDVKMYNGVHEFNNPTVQAGTGTAPAYGTPEEMTVASLTAYASAPVTKYAKVHVTAPASGFDCTDGTNTVNVFDGTGSFNDFRNKAIVVTGYLMGYYNGKVQFLATEIEEEDIAFLNVSPDELLWDDDEFGVSNVKTINVSVNSSASGYTVSGTNSDWTVSDDGEGTISVYPNAANTSTTVDKVLTLTITHEDDATLSKTVTCTQSKNAATDWSKVYISNVTLSTSGGTSASTCKVAIGGTQYDGLKAGTGKVAGAVKITVPSGTTKLHLHFAAWNGENVTLTVTPSGYSSGIALTANSGIANNSPFTFSGDPSTSSYYKTIEFSAALTADTDLTFTATGGNRFVVWGVNNE